MLRLYWTVKLCFMLIAFTGAFPLWAEDCVKAKAMFNESLNVNNKEDQEKLLKEAIALCPTFAEAYNNLGLLLEEKGKLDEALEAYRKASEAKKDFPHPYAGMGDVYRKKDLCAEAVKSYNVFLSMVADQDIKLKYPEIANFVSYVEGNVKNCEAKLKPQEKETIETSSESTIVTAKAITEALTKKTRGINAAPSIPIKIHFATNSATIAKESYAQMEEIGRAMSDPSISSYKISIEGHTDNVGDPDYNLELSRKRAESVKQYVVDHFKIDPNRLVTKGFGAARPIASNDTSWGRAQNRRVELVNIGLVGNGGEIGQKVEEESSPKTTPPPSSSEQPEKVSSDLPAPPKELVKIAILELDFLDRSGRQDPLGRMIAEFLTTSAVESGRFSIVERSLLDKVTKELELGQSGLVEEGKAREIGRMVGAAAILTGSVSRMGNTMRIDTRLIDVESGKIIAAANELTDGDLQSLSRSCASLINKLVARINK